jgi:DNA end-binding protein Ku
MARPIWSGAISFGLLNIPVQLVAAEKRTDLHFRLLDHRDSNPIRYERVNSETGEEVPWKEIVKAFEYEKGSYVVVEKEDIAEAAPESNASVDIQCFIDPTAIGREYYERPYYLLPEKKAEKGYVLLRETLRKSQRVGLSRVVIRTREHLALVVPEGHALVLLLLRFPAELLSTDHYAFPDHPIAFYKIGPRELKMAEALIDSMTEDWNPAEYRDEFQEKLAKAIDARVKKKTGRRATTGDKPVTPAQGGGKVVDFMALLSESIDRKRRTPAKSSPLSKALATKTRTKATVKPPTHSPHERKKKS